MPSLPRIRPSTLAVCGVLLLFPAIGLTRWDNLGEWGALALLAVFALALEPEGGYERRFTPAASPESLAAIRILVCLILLGYVSAGDLAATARLPREMLRSMGTMDLLHLIPGFDAFLANEQALGAFHLLTILALVVCGAGLGAPLSAPVAAVCSLVYFGIFWHYTYFYHQGLFALTMIAALAFTPCCDALSLDRKLGRSPRGSGPRAYAWGRYLCWTVLALPYGLAGLSKLRVGGLGWWDPLNLRVKIYRDLMRNDLFDASLGEHAIGAPDAFFGALGLFTLAVELGYVAVLFSRRARRVLPPLAMTLHLGILALQNFIFWDGLLLHLIFFDFSPLARRVGLERGDASGDMDPGPFRTPAVWAGFVAVMMFGWIHRAELYPISSWGMYAGRTSNPVVLYYRGWAETANGGSFRAPVGDCFPGPSRNPFFQVPYYAFHEGTEEIGGAFYRACGEEWNRRNPDAEPITRIRLEERQWDTPDAAQTAARGRTTAERIYEISGAEHAEAPATMAP